MNIDTLSGKSRLDLGSFTVQVSNSGFV